ncbi:hypothetical protein M3J09_000895 [Ascochyta lentis]
MSDHSLRSVRRRRTSWLSSCGVHRRYRVCDSGCVSSCLSASELGGRVRCGEVLLCPSSGVVWSAEAGAVNVKPM